MDSQTLETNMDNITNELSDLIVATKDEWIPSVNEMIDDANRLIIPIQKPLGYFSNIEEIRCSLETVTRINRTALPQHAIPSRLSTGAVNSRLMDARSASGANFESHKPLICCAATDEFKPEALYKSAQTTRRANNHNNSNTRRKLARSGSNDPIDYDNIVIDLNMIGLNIKNEETNDVLRLFGLFRKLQYYLNDIIPSQPEPDLTDYPKVYVKPLNPMPCTMNVQSQIKYAMQSLHNYCHFQFESLDEYKMADYDKYIECTRSLFVLRRMVKHLEPFKNAEFEHKQGIFVNSFGAAQSKNLEILLSQIIGKVRECNIYVEVYIWSVKKNIQRINMPCLQTLNKAVAIAGAIIKNSPTKSLEETEAINENIQQTPDIDYISGIGSANGNGDGFGQTAVMSAPPFNMAAIRYIGA